LKADKTEVDLKATKTELGLKADKTEVDTKAPLASPIFTGNITGNLVGNVTGNSTSATSSTNIIGGSLGSIPYQTATGATGMISGNSSTSKQFLTQTGNGINAAAPSWASLSTLDITSALGFTPANATNAITTSNLYTFITATTATNTISNATTLNTVITYAGTASPIFNLPDPATNVGKIFIIKYKNTNGSGNRNLIINPNGTEKIDFFASGISYSIQISGGAIKNIQILSDGTNWLFLN